MVKDAFRPLWVVVSLLVADVCHAWIWDARDPAHVARNAPVIVTGEIVSIDVADPGTRVFDVAHIKISRVHKNLLSGVQVKTGKEINVRMVGKNCRTRISTDLRYPVGTKALWLIFLEKDGHFYISKRPEQRLPVATLEKFYLRGVLRVRRGPYTKLQWLKRPEKAGPGTHQLVKQDDLAELRPEIDRVVTVLIDEDKPLGERLAFAADQPFKIRRPVINQIIGLRTPGVFVQDPSSDSRRRSALSATRTTNHRLRGRQKIQKQVLLFFLRNDKTTNMRAASASGLGVVKPMDQETIDALTKVILNEEPMVRLMAAQTVGFCQPADATDMSRVHDALLKAMETDDVTESFSVARASTRALGFRKSQAARDRIAALFKKHRTDVKVAVTCAEALGKIGGADLVVLEAAHVALASKNWNIRHRAAMSLQNLPAKNQCPSLCITSRMKCG